MGRKPKLKSNNNMTLFQWLDEIMVKKRSWEQLDFDDKSGFNSFMINKYLSMNSYYIDLVNIVQKIPYSNKKQIYEIYRNLIPQKKVWLKYIGSKKKSKNGTLEEYISKYFECSLKEAEDYIDLLNKTQINEILEKMGLDNKEIKKLLK